MVCCCWCCSLPLFSLQKDPGYRIILDLEQSCARTTLGSICMRHTRSSICFSWLYSLIRLEKVTKRCGGPCSWKNSRKLYSSSPSLYIWTGFLKLSPYMLTFSRIAFAKGHHLMYNSLSSFLRHNTLSSFYSGKRFYSYFRMAFAKRA